MNIALIAHDAKETDANFCIAYRGILSKMNYMPQELPAG